MSVRTWLFRFSALGMALVAMLLVLEVGLRIAGWSVPYYGFDPNIGNVILPDASFRVPADTEGAGRVVRSNALGHRDVEHAAAKPPGTERIVVLGDSFCEALQVDLEDTFFRRLQARLDDGAPEGSRPVEVINTGVSGYGTDRELLMYRHVARDYDPDVVLLLFVFNDVRNNYRPMQLAMYGGRDEPYFVHEGDELRLLNHPAERGRVARLKSAIARRMYTISFLRKAWRGIRLSRTSVDAVTGIPADYLVFSRDYDEDWTRAWQVTLALLTTLDREVRADGARLVVVGVTNDVQVNTDHRERMLRQYPGSSEIAWDWTKPQRLIGEFCDREGIPFVDLLPGFQEAARTSGDPALHHYLGHWNERGHAVAADILDRALDADRTATPDD